MNLGYIDRRITIQTPTETKDTLGGVVNIWSLYATVWAKAKPVRGDEYFSAQQVNTKISMIFTIRWMSGITSKMRVLYDGHTYGIQSIMELGRREALELYAEESRG